MIGWYVHHHGWGHATRLRAIIPHLDDEVTVFSSLPQPTDLPAGVRWVRLPSDADDIVGADGARRPARHFGDETARGSLHWAPIAHPGHRARLAVIADWAAASEVSAFVVDVSAEVAAFVRLLGIPTVVVAQPGRRTDRPHRMAYEMADRILAPWAAGTVPAEGLTGFDDRVRRVGGVSRYDGRRAGDSAARRVLFLGRTVDDAVLRRAIALLRADGWSVETAGAGEGDRVDDVWPMIAGAHVVVSAAGQNSVADLAAANARAVVVPQARPFDEQGETGRVLAAGGWADVAPSSTDPEHLVRLVQRASDRTPDWSGWQVRGAAARAAAVIGEVRV
ncbi:glycosyl transferase family 28 [Microbacterium sp. SLBN-154]|uniref:glycosyltransferase n=1 Tax=Microbacterium sp. SLBN-154 TaxID=2768458 RepID=UPI00114FDC0D|nr:glycosyltransferase [Microbacterium sp. SLBN-154]TQK20698.1 glycosyl transferase family 28 [Microbacterium sp. SLBN-154]